MGFFNTFAESLKDEDTHIASSGKASAEFSGHIDTGSYMLNALFSASIFGGVPNNKVGGFAGESSTGKTFFILGIIKSFLDSNPNAGVIYYDSEAAVTMQMMMNKGIDVERVIISEPDTIQKFRTQVLNALDKYGAIPEAKRPPMLMVLDSLGMLSSTKELADTAAGAETRDMTKAQIIRATFRVITLKLAKVRVPMLVTAHVYAAVGAYFPTNAISGGGGLIYAASTIVMLSKKKDKVGTDVVGNIIKVRMQKSRVSKEHKEVEVKLSYSSGLDKHYGLLTLGEKYGIFTKLGTRWEMPDGSKAFEKAIYNDPARYFPEDILKRLDDAARIEFSYGAGEKSEFNDDELPEADEEE